ncbi:MAG: helix-turn-helix transcriptional regulator [bacterium]|nr:helix-turn-helix transcriptional regulator [bacterium]
MMKFDDKKFIAEKIKSYRKRLGLTQEELAEKAELSVQHISRIENGCYIPSLKSFFLIITALKIDLKEFGFDVEPTNNPIKDTLISHIINSTNTELILYDSSINAIKTGLSKIRTNIF